MKTINKNEIKTARELELFFWKFHNDVNERSKKAFFPQEKLTVYKEKDVKSIIKEFNNVLSMYYRNNSLSTKFNTFIEKNENKFTYYEPLVTNPKKDSKPNPKKDSKPNPKKDSKPNPKKDSIKKDSKANPKIKPKKYSNANANPKKSIFTMLFRKFTKK
jgi:hypothetical protein